MRLPFVLLAAMAGAFSGLAQVGGMGFSGRMFYPGPPVTGAPYAAERISERVQVAADGTRFTNNTQHEKIYRDSEGRIRTERPVPMGPNAPTDAPVFVEIRDPVANAGYILDPQNKIAHRIPLENPQRVAAAQQHSSQPAIVAPSGRTQPATQTAKEDLGQQTMEGVMAEGRRVTHTYPTGSQGNDRPFQSVTETWYSPEIHEMVLVRSTDPRMGEDTMKLIHISRTVPDPSLFMPPADYTVVDETGPFQIQWRTRQ